MDPRTYVATLASVLDGLAALAAAEPADLPASLAAEVLPDLVRAGGLAEVAVVAASGRIDSSGLWAVDGARSGAAWIAERTGMSRGEAGARVSAARLIAEQPEVWDEPWRAGRVGLGHLTALARAINGPGSHKVRRRAALGAVAGEVAAVAASVDATTFRAYLDQWCAQVDPLPLLEAEREAWAARYLTFSELGGEVLLEGRLPLAEGRRLRAWCEAWVEAHHRRPADSPLDRAPGEHADDAGAGRTAGLGRGDRTPRPALLADSLLHLAGLGESGGGVPVVNGSVPQVLITFPSADLAALAGRLDGASPPGAVSGPIEGRPPDPGGPADAEDPPWLLPPDAASSAEPSSRRRPAPPWPGSVPALLGGRGAVPISVEQARRHSCGDAEVRRLVLDPASVATELGRSVRIVPKDLRLLLVLRDGTCRFPGCRVPASGARVHHLVHWADGGRTDRASLGCFCEGHHHAIHEGGFVVVGEADAELHVYRPDGRLVGTTRPARAPGEPWPVSR